MTFLVGFCFRPYVNVGFVFKLAYTRPLMKKKNRDGEKKTDSTEYWTLERVHEIGEGDDVEDAVDGWMSKR